MSNVEKIILFIIANVVQIIVESLGYIICMELTRSCGTATYIYYNISHWRYSGLSDRYTIHGDYSKTSGNVEISPIILCSFGSDENYVLPPYFI